MLGVHRSKLLHINAHSRFAHTHLHFFLPLNAVQNPPPHILSLACSSGNTTTPNTLPLLLFPPTQTHALSITTHLPLSSKTQAKSPITQSFSFLPLGPYAFSISLRPSFFLSFSRSFLSLAHIPKTRALQEGIHKLPIYLLPTTSAS